MYFFARRQLNLRVFTYFFTQQNNQYVHFSLRITRLHYTTPRSSKKTIDGLYLLHDLSCMVSSLSNVMSRKYNCILPRWGTPGEFTLLLNFIKQFQGKNPYVFTNQNTKGSINTRCSLGHKLKLLRKLQRRLTQVCLLHIRCFINNVSLL